ncbi:hypothetical protein [Thalassolituus marinus]|uniref:Sel1 repeat family protein n=1 Tax=Thalassolituus marinus TaxID=671053 RepID=A0ABS7ZMR9_9GAMM|nr:hypothetical protein [Thalassolituus marinus]MCA6062904.1 hypothetical protein [Thalassolituus marinus]
MNKYGALIFLFLLVLGSPSVGYANMFDDIARQQRNDLPMEDWNAHAVRSASLEQIVAASARGNVHAKFILAVSLLYGANGFEKKQSEARVILEGLLDSHYSQRANVAMAEIYSKGLGVSVDSLKAKSYFTKAFGENIIQNYGDASSEEWKKKGVAYAVSFVYIDGFRELDYVRINARSNKVVASSILSTIDHIVRNSNLTKRSSNVIYYFSEGESGRLAEEMKYWYSMISNMDPGGYVDYLYYQSNIDGDFPFKRNISLGVAGIESLASECKDEGVPYDAAEYLAKLYYHKLPNYGLAYKWLSISKFLGNELIIGQLITQELIDEVAGKMAPDLLAKSQNDFLQWVSKNCK